MSAAAFAPGAAPVAHMRDFQGVEAGALRALRFWSAGIAERADLTTAYKRRHGPRGGREALEQLDWLLSLCERFGRRPLARQGVGCPYACTDECWFARLVALASNGEREEALMVAMTLIRPDMAPGVVDVAAAVGLTLPGFDQPTRPAAPALRMQQRLH